MEQVLEECFMRIATMAGAKHYNATPAPLTKKKDGVFRSIAGMAQWIIKYRVDVDLPTTKFSTRHAAAREMRLRRGITTIILMTHQRSMPTNRAGYRR